MSSTKHYSDPEALAKLYKLRRSQAKLAKRPVSELGDQWVDIQNAIDDVLFYLRDQRLLHEWRMGSTAIA